MRTILKVGNIESFKDVAIVYFFTLVSLSLLIIVWVPWVVKIYLDYFGSLPGLFLMEKRIADMFWFSIYGKVIIIFVIMLIFLGLLSLHLITKRYRWLITLIWQIIFTAVLTVNLFTFTYEVRHIVEYHIGSHESINR